MRFIYFSILFGFYKIIKLGKGGELWSACSASIVLSILFTISLHFTIGEIIGRELMVKYHSILWGNIILISFIIANFYFFVMKKKYLEIEIEFSRIKHKIQGALVIFIIFILWVILAFYLAFSNSPS
jgi:hypothetical protein